MKILGSLTNRIFLASAALAVMSIGFAVYFVSRTTTREAEKELLQVIHIGGDNTVEAHRYLAAVYIETKNNDRAVEQFAECVRQPLRRECVSGRRDGRVRHRGLGRDRTSDQRIMSPPL